MGYGKSKSLTESGIKYISQFFILISLLILAILFFSVALFLNNKNLIEFSISQVSFVGILIFLYLLTFVWLIRGLADIFNGRKEFDEAHESSVILGTILIIIYIFLFLATLAYSKGFAVGTVFIAAVSTGFSSSYLASFIGTIILSLISHILFGLALVNLILNLLPKEQKKKLWKIFYLFVASTFTFGITGLIAYVLFFRSYQEINFMLCEGKLKAAVNAPCPYCNRDIPIESKVCPYCATEFEKDAIIQVDPILSIDVPKTHQDVPKGYAPIKGPTEEEKKKLFRLIGIIIAIIIFIAIIAIIFK